MTNVLTEKQNLLINVAIRIIYVKECKGQYGLKSSLSFCL